MTHEGPLNIPARVTASELAELIDVPLPDVQAALSGRGQPSAPEDIVGGDLAIDVSTSLGARVTVEARDLALERLYEFETRGEVTQDAGGRAGSIVNGVISDLDELDALIESVAENWSVARMPVIDRNIIRMGIYELRDEGDTPVPVIMAEAVRLAQTYSTERSASFVNGVLSTLAKSIRNTG